MAFHIDARMDQRTDYLSHPTSHLATDNADATASVTHPPPVRELYTPPEVEPLLRELEQSSAFLHRKLKFSIHKILNRVIVKVIDAESDKVIKELPPEELQRASVRIREAVGLLIDEER